ncbi:MAG: hypothetical protein NT141_02535, partial [candidate division WWE3 bacterium]|nr:hypothetical protein [candidate division WWE3 bacterium]
YLIGYQLHKEDELSEALKILVDTNKVIKNINWYSLPSSTVQVDREERRKISEKKIAEAYRICKPLFFWPYMQGIFVTGSVAAKNATEKSDTDVMIVTSPSSLWLTRLIAVCYLLFVRKYRSTICPNIWVTSGNLAWEDQNIYTAFNLVMTTPILNRNYIYEKFLVSNKWVAEFLPQGLSLSEPVWTSTTKQTNVLIKLLDKFAYDLQLKFMKTKMTSEEVTLNKAHFKKNDNRQKILDTYKTNLHIHAAHSTHS